LEAAAHILERKGFAGYNTNAIAGRAGVSVGSLYQYFPNKDALTAALIERETSVLLNELGSVAAQPSFSIGLTSMVRAAVAHQTRRPTLARLLDIEEHRLPLGPQNDEVGHSIVSFITALLDRPNAPPVADKRIAATDVLAIVKGMVDAAGQRGETDASSLEVRVRRAVNGYLRQEA
jgi:AcrR family transcriptional regulator